MDHPRIRGEHVRYEDVRPYAVGSSPHTRGAPGFRDGMLGTGRIIPAYAGSTFLGGRRLVRLGDHPRIRGEHFATRRPRISIPGSSPHTRGARRLRQPGRENERIIPAYAGSTRGWGNGPGVMRDHPRIRGEHPAPPRNHLLQPGSSPHTRGAHRLRDPRRLRAGIIPAYAGSTAVTMS